MVQLKEILISLNDMSDNNYTQLRKHHQKRYERPLVFMGCSLGTTSLEDPGESLASRQCQPLECFMGNFYDYGDTKSFEYTQFLPVIKF